MIVMEIWMKYTPTLHISFIAICLCLACASAYGSTLLDFNEQGATGTTWPGWTWTLSASYSDPGWKYNNSANNFPRLFRKSDYGNMSLAAIDTTMKAPNTSAGASLKIYDVSGGNVTTGSISFGSKLLTVSDPTGYQVGDAIFVTGMLGTVRSGTTLIDAINGNVITLRDACNAETYCAGSLVDVQVKPPMQPSFWAWYDYKTMLSNAYATASNDRFSMYVYLQGYPTYSGGDPGDSFEWGTYNCWPNGGYGGESCPTEANNQHYYHTLNINPGTWVHILWDKHPSHQRSVSSAVANNPTMLVSTGKDYFETMNAFYLQATQFSVQKDAAFWADELVFTSAADLGESNQNDISIANLYVGYWAGDNHWEIGWGDLSDYSNHDSLLYLIHI